MTITKTEAAAILDAIKANRTKIDGCAKHLFPMGDPPYPFGMKLTCTNCGGTMDSIQAFRYTQGYKAAGGNPNDVIPGYE